MAALGQGIPGSGVATPIGLQPGSNVPTATRRVEITPDTEREPSYWETPNDCHPNRQVFKCPIWIFVLLMVIGAIINIWAWLDAPKRDRDGNVIMTLDYWIAIITGVAFHVLVLVLGAWLIFENCRRCQLEASGVIFLLAILIPIVSALLVGLIIGSILNVGFLWTARKEPNKD